MKQYNTIDNYIIIPASSGRSNSFLISSENRHILIDSGSRFDYNNVLNVLKKNIPKGDQLSYLILTHTHFDHVENAARLQKHFGMKIIVHRNETQYLIRGNTPVPAGTNRFFSSLVKAGKKLIPWYFNYTPVLPDIMVDDHLDLRELTDLDLQIIHTPGHSSGSLSIIINREYAVVGDALIGIFEKSVFPPFADKPDVMLKSWKKLLDTNCHTFLPGHGNEIERSFLESEYHRHRQRLGI